MSDLCTQYGEGIAVSELQIAQILDTSSDISWLHQRKAVNLDVVTLDRVQILGSGIFVIR
jgi:hypothetical protein